MIDPQKLARYEALTIRSTQLKSEWEAVEMEREEIRREILGEPVTKDSAKVSQSKTDRTDNTKRGLSTWERLRREPPAALKSTVAVVKELGRATNKQVAEKLGVSVTAASLRLSRAARDGFLTRVAQGFYEVHPLGGVMMPPTR